VLCSGSACSGRGEVAPVVGRFGTAEAGAVGSVHRPGTDPETIEIERPRALQERGDGGEKRGCEAAPARAFRCCLGGALGGTAVTNRANQQQRVARQRVIGVQVLRPVGPVFVLHVMLPLIETSPALVKQSRSNRFPEDIGALRGVFQLLHGPAG